MSDGLDRSGALQSAKAAAQAELASLMKAQLTILAIFSRALFAGLFVGLGAFLVTAIRARLAPPSYGVTKLLEGLAFAAGVIPIVLIDAELFGADSLLSVAFVRGKVSLRRLLRNWIVVYLGNALGALAVALAVYLSLQYRALNGAVAANILAMASDKCELGFLQAVVLGIMGSALVCLAVWMSLSGRTALEKAITIVLPISAAIAAEFEYSIMNLHVIPLALLIKVCDPTLVSQLTTAGVLIDTASLTVRNLLLANLLPVTIGNVVGGAGVVALAYWDTYLRKRRADA